MKSVAITAVSTQDVRFQLKPGEGVDAIHTNPQYAYAVTLLHTDATLNGVGLALTLGAGTEMVCDAIQVLAQPLVGREIEELMADFGQVRNITTYSCCQKESLCSRKGFCE